MGRGGRATGTSTKASHIDPCRDTQNMSRQFGGLVVTWGGAPCPPPAVLPLPSVDRTRVWGEFPHLRDSHSGLGPPDNRDTRWANGAKTASNTVSLSAWHNNQQSSQEANEAARWTSGPHSMTPEGPRHQKYPGIRPHASGGRG